MTKYSVLIADDDEYVFEVLSLYLSKEGYEAIPAKNGEEALKIMYMSHPDVIILDIMMPYIDGIEVCRRIRSTSKVPIIMLSARGEDFDRILGLELGADDYVTKPFNPREVLARIKTIMRRIDKNEQICKQSVNYPGLEINLTDYYVKVKSLEVPCTPKETEILWYLAANPGRVFSREQLLQVIWGYDYFGDSRTVDTHIRRLRSKIDTKGLPWDIKTVWGIGYKFEVCTDEKVTFS